MFVNDEQWGRMVCIDSGHVFIERMYVYCKINEKVS